MPMSYKDAFTNMLVVFVNQRIKESKDMTAKVEALDEKKQKAFQKKVIEHITTKARALTELQGLNYVGVTDNIIVEWIDDFFNEFEENMKEPEKKETKTKETKTKETKTKEYKIEEGIFGIEVIINKKKKLSKEEFIEEMEKESKEEIEFEWEEKKVIVKPKEIQKTKNNIKNEEEKETPNPEVEDDDDEDEEETIETEIDKEEDEEEDEDDEEELL